MDDIRLNPKCDREIAVYGYLRGTKLKGSARVHIAGVGDATVSFCSSDDLSFRVPNSNSGSIGGSFSKPACPRCTCCICIQLQLCSLSVLKARVSGVYMCPPKPLIKHI